VLLRHSDIFFNRELPDVGDGMDAHLWEHINESVPEQSPAHHGAFLQ
jgi:hypothetical protein